MKRSLSLLYKCYEASPLPSIHLCLSNFRVRGGWSLSQLSQRLRQGTPWTACLWTASAEPTTSTQKHLKPPCCEVTVLATTPPSPAHFKACSNVHNMSAVKKTAHQSALKRTYYRLKLWIKIQSEAQLSMLPTQAGWVTVFDTRLHKLF